MRSEVDRFSVAQCFSWGCDSRSGAARLARGITLLGTSFREANLM